jgi:hypothetical protein
MKTTTQKPTRQEFENEILSIKTLMEENRTEYHQLETSFSSRVEKIKSKMFDDYMERRKIYEDTIDRLTKKITKQVTKKYVEGQILTKRGWGGEKFYILVSRVFGQPDDRGYRKDFRGFSYLTIGVSGVGTKSNNYWMDESNVFEKDSEIEIVCDTKNFVSLCEKYGIKKPKLCKVNMEIIYENLFNTKLNGEFNYTDLHKLGIITK